MAEAVPVSDAMAVERTLGGDRDAYRVLVERHSRTVYRMAYRMMGNAHDAEEVVQESFLRAYQKLKQFAGNANFGTWVTASRQIMRSTEFGSGTLMKRGVKSQARRGKIRLKWTR